MMKFLTLQQLVNNEGEWLLYDLLDKMGYSNVKEYVCFDGRPLKKETNLKDETRPRLNREEIALLKMITFHYYKNFATTCMPLQRYSSHKLLVLHK